MHYCTFLFFRLRYFNQREGKAVYGEPRAPYHLGSKSTAPVIDVNGSLFAPSLPLSSREIDHPHRCKIIDSPDLAWNGALFYASGKTTADLIQPGSTTDPNRKKMASGKKATLRHAVTQVPAHYVRMPFSSPPQ